MRLDENQMQLLAGLWAAHTAVVEAQADEAAVMRQCWEAGIPASRIGMAVGAPTSNITRRFSASATNRYGGLRHENVDQRP